MLTVQQPQLRAGKRVRTVEQAIYEDVYLCAQVYMLTGGILTAPKTIDVMGGALRKK